MKCERRKDNSAPQQTQAESRMGDSAALDDGRESDLTLYCSAYGKPLQSSLATEVMSNE